MHPQTLLVASALLELRKDEDNSENASCRKKHNNTSYQKKSRLGGKYVYTVGIPPDIPDAELAAKEGVNRSTIWRRRQKALKLPGFRDKRSHPGGSRAKGARKGVCKSVRKSVKTNHN